MRYSIVLLLLFLGTTQAFLSPREQIQLEIDELKVHEEHAKDQMNWRERKWKELVGARKEREYARDNVVEKQKSTLDSLPDHVQIVGCYKDGVIKEPKNGNCLYGPGRKNIMTPPVSHIRVWRKYYNDRQIINRLALVNFESSFDENAHNDFAIGYVQTLRSHGVAKDIDSQLERMRNREKRYSDGGKYCGRYWTENNEKDGERKGEDGVLACLYRYHNHAGRTWYSKRGMQVTRFYRSILRS